MFRYFVFALMIVLSLVAFGQGTTPQQIELLPISDQTFGTAPFQVVALASSDLPVTLSAQGPVTLSGRFLTITGTGAVTISAQQNGNATYAPASAQATFTVLPATPMITAQPATIVYGTPFNGSVFGAAATAVPLVDAAADVPTVTWQLDTSAINGGSAADVTVPYNSPLLRYEGGAMGETTTRLGWNAMAPDPTIVSNIKYKVAFTCDCQQFEFAVQSGGDLYQLWVDGSWVTPDAADFPNHYFHAQFFRVTFPDKRVRQIKVLLVFAPPFYGLVVGPGDTISAPQVPVGDRVILFGDSWTGPTIEEPVSGAYQPGTHGAGYAQTLGEYFNWDWWEEGLGGTGFVNPGPSGLTWPQRALFELCGRSPDRVVVFGGANDGSYPEAVIQEAATLFLTEVTTCLPTTPIYLIGPQGVEENTATAMAAAAALFPANVTYGGPGTQTWIYGNPNDPTTGNAYLYINGHPTPLGHNFLAEKVAETIMGITPSLAQPAISLFAPAAAAGSFGYSAEAGSLLNAGVEQIGVTFTPADNENYATATQTVTLTVNQASSTLSLSTSAANLEPGESVSFVASVTPQIGGVPTGTIHFSDGGQALGSAALNSSGVATFATSSLTPGSHSIAAEYAGDANFLAAPAATPVKVMVATPDFSMQIDPTGVSVIRGQSAMVQITATSLGELATKLNLICSGLPANTSCTLRSGTGISIANNAATSATLIIEAEAPRTSASGNGAGQGESLAYALLFGTLFCGKRSRKATAQLLFLYGALLVGGTSLSGCGVDSALNYPMAGTYRVQVELVNASNPSMAHSQTLVVIIR